MNKKAPVQTLCMTMFTDRLLAKRHHFCEVEGSYTSHRVGFTGFPPDAFKPQAQKLSLIHISEPTRLDVI
eukprot:9020264-Prorocentrum_lima.AAC.1